VYSIIYPANASFSAISLAGKGEVFRQQRPQLTVVALGIVEEVFTRLTEVAE
jgi:hypothetical protein